ncbi:Cytochrome C oxidase, cbb3-type, subunit III [Marinobacter daqiaonensis]|uniref:Cytochrome C oxidase, cbb3-type, subunit III n=1 Tax=Marinobacter daqiaonensis TaxID=650891 RepID=A0A1I6GSX3_9GAMM|nr:DUF1592 domain-containing protein [Marinobacter daqiaonensis]SFR45137.1 Cytochrome C oxidase, cbb3-type, subunit III [Marinobacter daqiaonensis]
MKPLFKLLTLTAGAMAGNVALANQLCTVEYQETANWGAGATHIVTVENNGPGLEQWDISWTFPGNETIVQLWKGHFDQQGNQVGVIDAGYNGTVATGGQFDFGFNLENPSGNLPTEFFLNGQSCTTLLGGQDPGAEQPGEPDNDAPDMSVMGWSLNGVQSEFGFVTVKNTDVAEIQSFANLQAYVDTSGRATLAIDLNTVDTGIDIRDQRIRDHLFSSGLLPTLYFTTQVDMGSVADLEPGDATTMTLDGRLTMNGISQDTTAEVLVIRTADNRIAVRTARPVMVKGDDFELAGGIETLRTIAGLSAIGQTVPVYFNLNFSAIQGDDGDNLMPVEAGTTPATPSIVNASYTGANSTVTVSWQDLSDNETGFVVKRRQGNGYWETRAAVDANQTQWMERLDSEGNYTYRVIAVNGSVPSASSGNVIVNAQPGDDSGDSGDNPGTDPSQNPDDGDNGNGGDGGTPDNGDGGDTGGEEPVPGDGDDNAGGQPDGAEIYASHCAACHGADGSGGAIGVSLTSPGELGSLVAYIERTMPLGNTGRCVDDCAEAVGQYIADSIWADTGSGGDGGDVVLEDETPGPRQLNLMTRYHYANAIRDLVGIDASDLTTNFPVEARVLGFNNNAAKNYVSARHLDEYLKAAETIAEKAVTERRSSLLSCDAGASGCSAQFVEGFGRRAFRRPLNSDEHQAYLSMFDAEGDFDEGMEAVITAMLVSPNFLYISELGEQTGSGNYELTPHEVATQLSFTYQGTIPDATLMAAADADQLNTPEQLEAQARRLLQSDKARVHLGHFAEQWLESDPASMGSKDPNLFPRFNGDVREAMHRELRAFFNHVVFDSTGRFDELFTADYVFVNEALADYYGLPGVSGDQLRLVQDTNGIRGGLLALGAVMASHGHANESAPIPRGNFVRRRLMCQDLPPPPEDLDTSGPAPDPSQTTRERFEARTGGDDCQTCHLYINGIGFGFEAFDGAGGFRTTDNNRPVNTYGVIYGLESLLEETSAAYDGVRQMQQTLVQTDSLKSCMSRQFYRFARGYIETGSDSNTLDNLNQLFANSGYDLQELMVGLTQLQTFTLRR